MNARCSACLAKIDLRTPAALDKQEVRLGMRFRREDQTWDVSLEHLDTTS